MTMIERPALRRLADRMGILAEYVDYKCEHRATSDTTRDALLRALGFEASSEAEALVVLEELESTDRHKILDAVRVVSTASSDSVAIPICLPGHSGDRLEWSISLPSEFGPSSSLEGHCAVDPTRHAAEIVLPNLALGYYNLGITLQSGGWDWKGRQSLIVTPHCCYTVAEKAGNGRLFGIWANLYSVRGDRNWGVGDLGDLKKLVQWTAATGGAFFGLNPLHALRGEYPDISPYRPITRLWRNIVYLDIDAIPELEMCPAVRKRLSAEDWDQKLQQSRSATRIDYDTILHMKRRVLWDLYKTFVHVHGKGQTPRGQEFRRFRDQLHPLWQSALVFLALSDHLAEHNGPKDWRHWPEKFRHPHSPDVTDFAMSNCEKVDFQCYVQFELDRQLRAVAEQTRELGMPIGLYTDLALGTAPDGADAWVFQGQFVHGVSIGAPPDDLGPLGQNWALPPVHPFRLRESGYAYWVHLLRSAFAHAGALRIDHVMGLLRQFWIPDGADGRDGAYVAYPADDLFAILALESTRHKAIVIGEDLGTVPPGFDDLLRRWGILSTRVLYFERDGYGEFRPPTDYSDRALVTANTHDLPPLVGFAEARDIELRRGAGKLPGDAEFAAAKNRRSAECHALVRRLQAEHLCPAGEAPTGVDWVRAAYALLSRTPAPLVGVSLDDLALESEPVNLPGTTPDEHPNWSRRMSISLADLRSSPTAKTILDALADRAFTPPG